MNYPIRVQIIDPFNVLSDVDKHQIRNMIWLRLSAVKSKVIDTQFVIAQESDDRFPHRHEVLLTAWLKSGAELETFISRVTVAAAIEASVEQMSEQVHRSIHLETSWLGQLKQKGLACRDSLSRALRLPLRWFQPSQSSQAS